MANLENQTLTTANTNIKVAFELERYLLELLTKLVGLIPDPSIANTMRKEMEQGHVKVEMLEEKDAGELKKLLADQGLKERKDYILATYRRQDGEPLLALYYNIKDEEAILGAKSKFDPAGRINRENSDFFKTCAKAGIGGDGTIDVARMEKFFQNCGVQFDLSKPLSKEDREYGEVLINSKFNFMSNEQKQAIFQKLSQSGVMEQLYATKAAGLVANRVLLNHSRDHLGYPSVKRISGLSEAEVTGLAKRAEIYGLKVAASGPDSDKKYIVSFADSDKDTMKLAYLDMKYDFYGEVGDLYRKQLEDESRYYSQTATAVKIGEYPDGTKLPDGCMLVGSKVEPLRDRSGKAVHDKNGQNVTARQTMEIGRGYAKINSMSGQKEAMQTMKISNQDFAERFGKIFGDSAPVLLNPQQAKEYKAATNERARMKILEEARTSGEHGITAKHVFSKSEMELIAKHEQLRSIVSQKLDLTQSMDGRMCSSLIDSPLAMYVKDQMINEELDHDTDEYYRGGKSFLNEAGMESIDLADALNMDEDQREYADGAVSMMETEVAEFDALEDDTASFECDCQIDSIFGGDELEEENPVMEQVLNNDSSSQWFSNVQENEQEFSQD